MSQQPLTSRLDDSKEVGLHWLDAEILEAISATVSEWDSREDHEAFDDL